MMTALLFGASRVCAQTVQSLTTAGFKEKVWNYETDKEWKFKGSKPVIIDMYATWCGPCKRLAPTLEEIQRSYGDKLQIYKVDTDREQALAQLFGVTSIPLLIFIPVDDKPVAVMGLRPKEQLVQIINEKLFPEKK